MALPWVRVNPDARGSEESQRRLVRFVDRVFGPHMTVEDSSALRGAWNVNVQVLEDFRKLTGRDPDPGEVIPMRGPHQIDFAVLAQTEMVRRRSKGSAGRVGRARQRIAEEQWRQKALTQKAKEMRSAWWDGFLGMFTAAFGWSAFAFGAGALWATPIEGLPLWVPPVAGWTVLIVGSLLAGQLAGNGRRREVMMRHQELDRIGE